MKNTHLPNVDIFSHTSVCSSFLLIHLQLLVAEFKVWVSEWVSEWVSKQASEQVCVYIYEYTTAIVTNYGRIL